VNKGRGGDGIRGRRRGHRPSWAGPWMGHNYRTMNGALLTRASVCQLVTPFCENKRMGGGGEYSVGLGALGKPPIPGRKPLPFNRGVHHTPSCSPTGGTSGDFFSNGGGSGGRELPPVGVGEKAGGGQVRIKGYWVDFGRLPVCGVFGKNNHGRSRVNTAPSGFPPGGGRTGRTETTGRYLSGPLTKIPRSLEHPWAGLH